MNKIINIIMFIVFVFLMIYLYQKHSDIYEYNNNYHRINNVVYASYSINKYLNSDVFKYDKTINSKKENYQVVNDEYVLSILKLGYIDLKMKIEEINKKPSKDIKMFSKLNKNMQLYLVIYKEEEIINNKKYTDYATYIRDSENRYYAVDGRIFCLGIPCIDN